MFGYCRPQRLDLTLRDNNHHRAHYCGMCGALKRLYGLKWRAATNFDTAFLALLISAQRSSPPEFRRRYCPFNRYWGFGVVVDDSIAVTTAASLTVVMMGLKIADALRDGAKGARLARFLTARAVAKAERELARFDGKLVEELRACDTQLVEWERRHGHLGQELSYDQLLLPTARGLGRVLEFTAQFADAPELAQHNGPYLRRLGEALGRLIYTLDCVHDLERDLKRGRFNGLIAAGLAAPTGKAASPEARDRLEYLAKRCWSEIELSFGQLRLTRYDPILANILFLGILPKVEEGLSSL